MSHELRTPLTAIIGVSDMLLKSEPSPEEHRRFMQMQKNAGQALLAIINDILDFSKIEAQQLHLENEPFAIREAAGHCMSIVSEAARQKGLPLAVRIADDVPIWVRGDAERLKQVLINLLSNAVKFTQAGSVDLSIERVDLTGEQLRFVITDTGIGIAEDDLSRIFERFSQADTSTTRRFGGTGLGLAISKKLVALMGGEITARSQIGRGSTFAFAVQLPFCAEPARFHDQKTFKQQSYRLLLAEDNELNRQLIAAMLEQAGHRVEAVADGTSAVHAASRADYDAILMDVQMPRMDGYAASRAIRATGNTEIPIIALTANALSDEVDRCMNAGMDAYFSKPIDWPGLLAAIDQLAGRTSASNRIQENRLLSDTERVQILNEETLERIRSSIGLAATTNLLKMFLLDARQQFIDIATDRDEIRKQSHSFGGSAGMLGFERLSRACVALNAQELSIAQFEGQLEFVRQERDIAVYQIENILAVSEVNGIEQRA